MHKMRKYLSWCIAILETRSSRDIRSKKAKQRRVGIDVMERCAMVNLRIVVEDVGIKP